LAWRESTEKKWTNDRRGVDSIWERNEKRSGNVGQNHFRKGILGTKIALGRTQCHCHQNKKSGGPTERGGKKKKGVLQRKRSHQRSRPANLKRTEAVAKKGHISQN